MTERFVEAQAQSYDRALAEIVAGRKATHWMWFIFPQLRSLGRSHNAQFYGIADLAEAEAYLAHPVLGSRLIEISQAMLAHAGCDPAVVLGEIDALKLRSCMSLFAAVPGAPDVFSDVLGAFYEGAACPLTLAALAGE